MGAYVQTAHEHAHGTVWAGLTCEIARGAAFSTVLVMVASVKSVEALTLSWIMVCINPEAISI